MMNKRYAIFDMDGTLIDSMDAWQGLAAEYLAFKGIDGCTADLLKEIETMTMSESAVLFSGKFPVLGSPKLIETEMNAMMEAHYRFDIPLKQYVLPYLQKLKAQGTEMCVASASSASLMEVCLERLGVRKYFRFLLSCEELHTSKRQPDIYLEAAKRFGSVPAETAVYEDAFYAAKTAKEAGFFVIGVYERSLFSDWEKLSSIADETIIM